jgi:cephalosporin hydroxylase
MFPFWDLAIAPIIEAVEAKRVVEIGALRGDTTELMLERLGPDVELHVIDPAPDFDPSEHEQRFAGRYVFHRDLSVRVLADLPVVDVALIDGDHNWYTVVNELRLLARSAERAGAPLPILVMHDVGWPYGRRDLYYDPETIPEEFRQQYDERGLAQGNTGLLKRGGLNPWMHNAVEEGGPRNGVMTALEDFLDEFDRPYRLVVVPVYFGLAVVAEQSVLDAHPALGERLDWLEGAEGRGELLQMGEAMRLQALTAHHGLYYRPDPTTTAIDRYLDLLKGALLDEHYMENEVRIDHLVRHLLAESQPTPNAVRDPVRQMKDKTRQMLAARRAGKLGDDRGDILGYFPYSTMGRVRLDHLQRCLDAVRTDKVKGDLVECGTGRGGGGVFLRGYAAVWEMTDRRVWIADTFRASPSLPDDLHETSQEAVEILGGGPGLPDLRADLNTVRDAFQRFDLLDDRLRFLQGDYRDTLPTSPIRSIALLRLGDDLEDACGTILDALYDRVTPGGFVVVEDFLSPAARKSIEDFRERRGIDDPIEQVDWSGVVWRKGASPSTSKVRTPTRHERPRGYAPLADPPPPDAKDLSVVVVFYNMRREAQRTLHALSRAYQENIDELDYEVIAVENGSSSDQRLGREFVEAFGPEFRYVDMGDDATHSPVPALNRGVAEAKGNTIALMIDGAHVVTPGVLHYGMTGLEAYAPAIVATQQWFLGPGQQSDVMVDGYDQQYEDRLLQDIGWPRDGYRLFDIGHFIGDRDWLDGLWESNCLFVPRSLLEQVGAFDESFDMPGGGFANLELYERLGSSTDVTVVTILGEGSFHQIHGGTTTNLSGSGARHDTLGSYTSHFRELRGRDFMGHRKPIHYVGSMFETAARTRARRRIAPEFFKDAADRGTDLPEEPAPIPQELTTQFLEAYWQSLAWRQTTWLGQRVPRPPTDLFAYQELLNRTQPDWIIDIRSGSGGRAWFLATVCDLIGKGQVIAIERKAAARRPEHDRIRYIIGSALDDEIVEEVHALVGRPANALVILGARGTARRIAEEHQLYEDLVPVGGYVVVEDTVINGHPVWPNFGPGPAEAVKGIVERRENFAIDAEMGKYRLSFNPNGFLRRMS